MAAPRTDPILEALAQLETVLAVSQPVQLDNVVAEVNRLRAARGSDPVGLAWLAEHALRAAGLTRVERKAVLGMLRPENGA